MSIKQKQSNKKVYEDNNKILEENEEDPISPQNSRSEKKEFSGGKNKIKEKENDRYDDEDENPEVNIMDKAEE